MATVLQIKRSLNTSIPASLSNGEFSYTANGDVLYIGSNGNIVAIAGKRNVGALTANQAIVVDSNSLIDKLNIGNTTTNVVANTLGLTVSNSTANFLYGPGGISTAPAGSNTYIQFNDSGTANGIAGFTYDKASNTVAVGNTITIGATATLNTTVTSLKANSAVNAVVNGSSFALNGQVNSTVNSSFLVNTSFISLGNSTVNLTSNSTTVSTANISLTATVNVGANVSLTTASFIDLANSSVNTVANGSAIAISGQVNSTVNSSFLVNTSFISLGNSTVNTQVNSSSITTGLCNSSNIDCGTY